MGDFEMLFCDDLQDVRDAQSVLVFEKIVYACMYVGLLLRQSHHIPIQ